jgi:hypothetical protein
MPYSENLAVLTDMGLTIEVGRVASDIGGINDGDAS